MLFNRWRKYPKRKPKESGVYQCTVQYGYGGMEDHLAILDLRYQKESDKWTDIRRQHVFDGYKVYASCRAPIEDNRVYTDGLCERIDVMAWRKLPNVYGWRKLKKVRSEQWD